MVFNEAQNVCSLSLSLSLSLSAPILRHMTVGHAQKFGKRLGQNKQEQKDKTQISVEGKPGKGGQHPKNASDCDEKQQLFLSRLEEAVANGGTKNLWRKYGNRITMQFKDRNLEAKVSQWLYKAVRVGYSSKSE